MNIERRRIWVEQIEDQIEYVDECAPEFQSAMDIEIEYRKRLLSLLRRVRRCPECRGIGAICWEAGNQRWEGIECPTCGGTGRL